MSRSLTSWLLRGLAAFGLIVIVALWMLAQPLPETPPPTLTPTITPTPTITSTPTNTPAPTLTPTPTPTPTITPSPTPACTESVGRVEQHSYPSQTSGEDEAYRIYLPPCYGYETLVNDRRYPVLYLLHGWPYDDAHWHNLGIDKAADAGIQAGVLPPLIIVMPKGQEAPYVRSSGGERSFEGQVINDLIPHVDATYHTLARRAGRAIGGISRGGVWSLEIGFLHSGLFAAVGAHSPALSVNLAPQVYSPFYLLNGPSVGMLRIYLDAGDADWAREGTQELSEALNAQGIVHEFVVHPGGHTDELWEANVVEYLAFYAADW